MTIKDALCLGALRLRQTGIKEPELESEILLSHCLKKDRIWLHLNPHKKINTSQFFSLIERRSKRIPIQHLLGQWEFWSKTFKLAPYALIPRQETELLVERALECARNMGLDSRIQILDLGTGTGVIAISLLLELPSAHALLTDIDLSCLLLARDNARIHGVEHRAVFLLSDWLSALSWKRARFDLIVSNPPYISFHQRNSLAPEVKDHEPPGSLYAKENGIFHIKNLLKNASSYLKPGGWFLCEIGFDQGKRAINIARQTKSYEKIELFKDIAGHDRVIAVRKGWSQTKKGP